MKKLKELENQMHEPITLEKQAENFIKYWGLDDTASDKEHATSALLELLNRARKEGKDSVELDCSECGNGPGI